MYIDGCHQTCYVDIARAPIITTFCGDSFRHGAIAAYITRYSTCDQGTASTDDRGGTGHAEAWPAASLRRNSTRRRGGIAVIGGSPRQVAPLLHLRLPEGHNLYEIAIDWPAGRTLADLERRMMRLGWLPIPSQRVDRLIVRIGAGSGLWRFSARSDWRRHLLNSSR